MTAKKFDNNFRIPSSRAQWHNYNGGMYFVTICTQNRKHYFGEIINGGCRDVPWNVSTGNEPKMKLSKIGKHLQAQLKTVGKHYSYAEIPLWVIMPNHIHVIIIIDHDKIPYELRNVEDTPHQKSLQQTLNKIQIATRKQSWLSVIVRQLKQSVTCFAKRNNISFAWQARFHDHIIRNSNEMNIIAKYIEENIAKWAEDRYYN